MATTLSESTNLVDSAIGPLAVREQVVEGYDIDDHVHSTARAQALQLRLKYRAQLADQRFTGDRPPIDIEDVQVGGY